MRYIQETCAQRRLRRLRTAWWALVFVLGCGTVAVIMIVGWVNAIR